MAPQGREQPHHAPPPNWPTLRRVAAGPSVASSQRKPAQKKGPWRVAPTSANRAACAASSLRPSAGRVGRRYEGQPSAQPPSTRSPGGPARRPRAYSLL